MKFLTSMALAICFFLAACAPDPEMTPTEKEEEENRPRLVGRVASIPAGRDFVLIQAYGTWTVETGSVLTTQGPDGRAANLIATGEKLGQYAAADIRAGTLEIGDGVYTISKIPDTKGDADEAPATEYPEPPAEGTTD